MISCLRQAGQMALLCAVVLCNTVHAAECNEEERCTRIVGVGLAAVRSDDEMSWAERRIVAVRAAKLDALRSIVEQVNGVRYQSRSHYGTSRIAVDRFSVSADGTISGVRFVRVEPLEGGIYQVTAELDLRR